MNECFGIELDDTEKDFIENIIKSLIVTCAKKKRFPSKADVFHKILRLAMKEYGR